MFTKHDPKNDAWMHKQNWQDGTSRKFIKQTAAEFKEQGITEELLNKFWIEPTYPAFFEYHYMSLSYLITGKINSYTSNEKALLPEMRLSGLAAIQEIYGLDLNYLWILLNYFVDGVRRKDIDRFSDFNSKQARVNDFDSRDLLNWLIQDKKFKPLDAIDYIIKNGYDYILKIKEDWVMASLVGRNRNSSNN